VLVHGTFSTGPGGFGGLTEEADWLSHAYGGQVAAFNHPSLSEDPRQNAERLLSELRERTPEGGLEIDLISHSRGGLVARAFAGLTRADTGLRLRRAVLVAAPLAGTRLTDGEHAHEMLDRYTNLVTALPDGVLGFSFETILALVKILYRGSVAGLPGLRSMKVEGDFLRELGYPGEEFGRYFSIVGNFAPTAGGPLAGLLRRTGDGLVDEFFRENNDLVVPTGGASTWTVGAVPEAQRLELPTEADPAEVHHGSYFTNGTVRAALREWLG
jgi:pimeloyl-ACP methyl ester carboxylesterase